MTKLYPFTRSYTIDELTIDEVKQAIARCHQEIGNNKSTLVFTKPNTPDYLNLENIITDMEERLVELESRLNAEG